MEENEILLSSLRANPGNPRTIKPENLSKLKNSIRNFKRMLEIRPIIVDETGLVLGGNMRFTGLKALGFTKIPKEWVKCVEELTDAEKAEFIIKDNVSYGEWDFELLAGSYDIGDLEDWGLEIDLDDSVFKEAEKDKPSGDDDDFEVKEDIPVHVKEGDLIEIGEHRLLCGSSTDVNNWSILMNGSLADMVVTDPPYNVDYTGKTKDALKIENDKMGDSNFYQFLYDFYTALGSYTKPGGAWYVWHADLEGANFRQAMKDAGIMVKQCLIWVKNSLVMGRQDYHWKHEPCLYGWKPGASHNWYSDRKQTTVLNFDRPTRNTEHPTMKPVELISYQIRNSSKRNDIVCDGFLGSGTSMVSSHINGRVCYGIELSPFYCQVIINRMLNLDPSLQVKINGKEHKP